MASISAAGVGSGLDINSIISQLMALERRPLSALQGKQATFESQLSAYGRLKSALSTFQSAMDALSATSKFKHHQAGSSDDDVLGVSASAEASPGTYEVVVSSQLAQNHKLASSAFTDASTVVGTGTLTISVGSESFEVAIDSGNNTLAGIRDAINSATDNAGVSATIINVTGGSRLILTARDSGAANALTVAVSGDGDNDDGDASGLSTLVWSAAGTKNLSQLDAAQDAAFTVDGFPATSASNAVTDVIPGVTLNLKSAGTVTVTVGRDDGKITETVQGFVDAYNALRKSINDLRAGDLKGDLALNSIQAGILSVINTPPSGIPSSFRYLSEIGVSIQKDGTMKLDGSALSDAMSADFAGIAELFANDNQGFAYRLKAAMTGYLAVDGIVDAREDGLNSRIDSVQNRIATLQVRMELVEKRLRAQYSALDSLLGSMRSTGEYLTQQLG
jgi:flagellar hook-associated protein 2